jgi:hypothetical protein
MLGSELVGGKKGGLRGGNWIKENELVQVSGGGVALLLDHGLRSASLEEAEDPFVW